MYLHGKSVPQDTAQALVWIRHAADRGAPAAQLQLGELYEQGKLVPRDLENAYYWYSIAAKGVSADVHITNMAAVQAVAASKVGAVARLLPLTQRAAVNTRVAQWQPRPSVPYVAEVDISGDAH
jgi:TPR repeat protein